MEGTEGPINHEPALLNLVPTAAEIPSPLNTEPLLGEIAKGLWEIMQALPTLSHETLVHIHKTVKDLKENHLNLALTPSGSIGSAPLIPAGNLMTQIATLEHTMKSKKRNRLGGMQCEQCGEPLASSPAVRRGPSGTKSLCNRCGLRFSKQLRKQEKTRNQMKLENLLHAGATSGGGTSAEQAETPSSTPAVSVLLPHTSATPAAAAAASSSSTSRLVPPLLKWDSVSPGNFFHPS